jgi:hypothetical protein
MPKVGVMLLAACSYVRGALVMVVRRRRKPTVVIPRNLQHEALWRAQVLQVARDVKCAASLLLDAPTAARPPERWLAVLHQSERLRYDLAALQQTAMSQVLGLSVGAVADALGSLELTAEAARVATSPTTVTTLEPSRSLRDAYRLVTLTVADLRTRLGPSVGVD